MCELEYRVENVIKPKQNMLRISLWRDLQNGVESNLKFFDLN